MSTTRRNHTITDYSLSHLITSSFTCQEMHAARWARSDTLLSRWGDHTDERGRGQQFFCTERQVRKQARSYFVGVQTCVLAFALFNIRGSNCLPNGKDSGENSYEGSFSLFCSVQVASRKMYDSVGYFCCCLQQRCEKLLLASSCLYIPHSP